MNLFLWGLSLLTAGEAIILFVVLYVLKHEKKWFSVRNTNFILLDIITGGGLIYILLSDYPLNAIISYELIAAGIITHLLRVIEYIQKKRNKFCFNIHLFIINDIKLLGFIVLLILII